MKKLFYMLCICSVVFLTACKKDEAEPDMNEMPAEPEVTQVAEVIEDTTEAVVTNEVARIIEKSEMYLLSAENYDLSMHSSIDMNTVNMSVDYNSTYYYTSDFRGTESSITITSDNLSTLFNVDDSIATDNTLVFDEIYDYSGELSVSRLNGRDYYDGYYDYTGKLESYSPYAIVRLLNTTLIYQGAVDGNSIKCNGASIWGGVADITFSFEEDYTPIGYTVKYVSDNSVSTITITYGGIDNPSVEECHGITMDYDTEAISDSVYLDIYEHAYFLMIGEFDTRTFVTPNTNTQNLDHLFSIDNLEIDVLNNPYWSFDTLAIGDLVTDNYNHYYTKDNYSISLISDDGNTYCLSIDVGNALMGGTDYPAVVFDYVSVLGLDKKEFLDSLFYISDEESSNVLSHTTYNSIGHEVRFDFFFDDAVGCYKVTVTCTDVIGDFISEEDETQARDIIDDGVSDDVDLDNPDDGVSDIIDFDSPDAMSDDLGDGVSDAVDFDNTDTEVVE